MYTRRPLAWLLALTILPFAAAQNFSGSDTFTSTSGNWSLTTGANGGTFVVNLGALNYRDNGGLASASSNALYSWTANAGSYTTDWQVQVDFKVPQVSSLVVAQFLSWNLIISNSADSNDYFSAGLENTYNYSTPKANAGIVTNNSTPTPTSQNITSATTATIYISYTASNHTLAASFNGGSGVTSLFSASVTDSGSNWNMVTGNSFNLALAAKNTGNASATGTLSDGDFTADNFQATGGTPVPEPATYAFLAGAAALGIAFWRRR